jgi:predicted Zn finger-like uncharacterized protein
MHVTCPNCSAAYEVPDRLLSAGPRLLQCTRCSHQFSVAPPPSDPAPEAPPAPPVEVKAAPVAAEAPAPPPAKPEVVAPLAKAAPLAAAPPTRKGDAGAVLGWVATLGLLAVSGVLIAANEARIIAAWPPAERLFDWIRQGVSAIQSI